MKSLADCLEPLKVLNSFSHETEGKGKRMAVLISFLRLEFLLQEAIAEFTPLHGSELYLEMREGTFSNFVKISTEFKDGHPVWYLENKIYHKFFLEPQKMRTTNFFVGEPFPLSNSPDKITEMVLLLPHKEESTILPPLESRSVEHFIKRKPTIIH